MSDRIVNNLIATDDDYEDAATSKLKKDRKKHQLEVEAFWRGK